LLAWVAIPNAFIAKHLRGVSPTGRPTPWEDLLPLPPLTGIHPLTADNPGFRIDDEILDTEFGRSEGSLAGHMAVSLSCVSMATNRLRMLLAAAGPMQLDCRYFFYLLSETSLLSGKKDA
jgi:hypothetical protein